MPARSKSLRHLQDLIAIPSVNPMGRDDIPAEIVGEQAVAEHVAASEGQALTVDMRFIYFNSSSAKAIMNLFQMLEEAAEDGKTITINWYFDPEDDMMEEMGEDFAEDFEHATFNLKPETEDA